MSVYIKLSTLEYPRHEGDIRREHPEILESDTWPNFPCPSTYALVEQTPPPSIVVGVETAEQTTPIFKNGQWVSQWIVRALTEQELELQKQLETNNLPVFSNNSISENSSLNVADASGEVQITPINP